MTSTAAANNTGPSGESAPRNIGAIAKERAAQRNTLAKADVFIFVKNPEKPVAPQANCIVECIKTAGPDGIGREPLIEVLKQKLVTRQPAERILTYYQKSLEDAGLIVIHNPGRTASSATPTAEPAEAAV